MLMSFIDIENQMKFWLRETSDVRTIKKWFKVLFGKHVTVRNN